MNWLKRIGLLLGLILIIGIIGFILWANNTAPISQQAEDALLSDETVTVFAESSPIIFQATNPNPTRFIYYPGGRVDELAYAPLARAIAEAGYTTYIVPMPLNLAVLDGNAADDILADFEFDDNWVIGGHSLGGAMAARYVDQFPDKMEGLILLGAFPAESNDLSADSLPVLSIYGTLDGLVEKSEAETPLLPADTIYLPIEGGNHAYFGDYGEQSGDNPATISRDQQQAITVDAIVQFLDSLE